MSLNRNFVYFVRKHLPDAQFIHNILANKKLADFRKQLLPEDLVKQGEDNPESIPEIISKLETERPIQVKTLTDGFDEYLGRYAEHGGVKFSDAEYKDERIQMLFNCMAYGFAPDEYIYYKLRYRTLAEKKGYITDLDRKMMQYIMSDFKELQYVFDKAATYEKFGKYYQRDEISVGTKADFGKFKTFAQKHDELVIKQVSASCGQGVHIEKVDRANLEAQFDRILTEGKCSIEERIIQSEITSVFNESSVNTLRVIAFNTKNGIKIGPCFYRTGRAGAFVDNAGAGGVFTGVNRHTGILETDGCDEYLNRYKEHPTSGVIYQGFQLPEWDKCIALVKEMCSLVPKLGYIGWDLAYTNKGWVLVEANGGSQFVSQICYDCGCKEEVQQYIDNRNVY